MHLEDDTGPRMPIRNRVMVAEVVVDVGLHRRQIAEAAQHLLDLGHLRRLHHHVDVAHRTQVRLGIQRLPEPDALQEGERPHAASTRVDQRGGRLRLVAGDDTRGQVGAADRVRGFPAGAQERGGRARHDRREARLDRPGQARGRQTARREVRPPGPIGFDEIEQRRARHRSAF